jgi:protein involved in polysaccharide export with SLBB domain
LLSATSVATSTSNYYFAKPNELTIIVNIVGFVQKPGRYEISNSIDLMNLIALAGGPMPDGSLNDVKITRVVKAAESRYSKKEIVLNLEHLSSVNPAELVLQPGDFIHVDKTGWSIFRDVFGVAVSAAILTTAVVQVINLTK